MCSMLSALWTNFVRIFDLSSLDEFYYLRNKPPPRRLLSAGPSQPRMRLQWKATQLETSQNMAQGRDNLIRKLSVWGEGKE